MRMADGVYLAEPPALLPQKGRVYLRPSGLLYGAEARAAREAGQAEALAGDAIAYQACDIVTRTGSDVSICPLSIRALRAWRATLTPRDAQRVTTILDRLSEPRSPLAGLDLDTPRLMGIVNVTPDSFSDGGDHLAPADAKAAAIEMAGAGAAIIDVGGESTRPGATPLTPEQEQKRVLPLVDHLAKAGLTVSIDSRNATTMAAAVARGARLINDVSALSHDPEAASVAAGADIPVVLMHAQGDPRSMQDAPLYDHAALDVYDALEERISAAIARGIDRDRLIVDPGIGFGKTAAHNYQIFRWLTVFHGLGCPILLGASRKSFIGHAASAAGAAGASDPKARLPGSLAALGVGAAAGVQIFRVHDVAASAQALAVWSAFHQ